MFRWVTDVARGDWIGPRLGPFGGWVGSVVPRGYPAYARVLHRAQVGADEWVRWADVAAATGATLHPTAQWWKVAGRSEVYGRGGWDGSDPPMGRLDRRQVPVLVEVLRGFTKPDAVTAAFWEGSSWEGGAWISLWVDDGAREHGSGSTGPDVDPAVLARSRLDLPGRSHLLFSGSLDDVAALAGGTASADVDPFRPGDRTPSLLWPDDRSWCVATEVDFDSTLVGGPRALVDAVLAHPVLEAFEVGEDHSLMADGDTVNR